MRKREHVTLRTKLAAALCIVGQIPHEHAKLMHEEQVLSLFAWDHYPIPHAAPFNGPDEHWNLTPSFAFSHRVKSSKIDTPRIAKTKRIIKRDGMKRAKTPRHPLRSRSSWPPKGSQKIRSRGFQRRQK